MRTQPPVVNSFTVRSVFLERKEAALRAAQPAQPTFTLGFLSGAEIGLLPAVDRILRDEFPGIDIRLSSDYSPCSPKP